MGARYLIDTNAAIDFLGGLLPSMATIRLESWVLEGECAISIINRIELYSIVLPPTALEAVNNFVLSVQIFKLSDTVADRTILIRQAHRLKLPDAVIAATCLENNLPVISRNQADFGKVIGLNVIDPYAIS
jgi:hypothetical protein